MHVWFTQKTESKSPVRKSLRFKAESTDVEETPQPTKGKGKRSHGEAAIQSTTVTNWHLY